MPVAPRMLRLLAVLFLVPFVGGCTTAFVSPGHPGPVPPRPNGALLCGLNTERGEERTIGPEGGTLTVGRHRLTVPPGALQGNTSFRMVERRSEYLVVWLRPFHNPGGGPVTVTLSTGRCGQNQPDRVAVVRYDPTRGWQPVEGIQVAGSAAAGEITATFSTHQFSHYALVAP